MTNQQIVNITSESLRDWFKKEKWVRISSSGNIAGPCGTSKNKKNPDRCLPKAKAQSLSKAERAATARKKKAAGKKGKTVVANTKKAKVTREGKEVFTNMHGEDMTMVYKPETEQIFIQHDDINTDFIELDKFLKRFILSKEEQNAIIAFYKKYIKDHKLPEGLNNETANPQDGKAAPYGSGYKKVTKEDIRNLIVGTIHEMQNEGTIEEKDDRCTRLAKQKYDTWPSAYASGAVVRCRRGEIWKKK